jgi:hypothetical protein
VSNSQREAGESLRRLGISHELEYTMADGLFSIDLAIDGLSHFTRNTLEPLGHTGLRDRLLSAMGWHVVSIPFFDSGRLHDRPEQMDDCVKQRPLQDPRQFRVSRGIWVPRVRSYGAGTLVRSGDLRTFPTGSHVRTHLAYRTRRQFRQPRVEGHVHVT